MNNCHKNKSIFVMNFATIKCYHSRYRDVFTSSFRFSIILSRIAFYATNFWLTIPKAIVKYVRRRQTFVTRFTKWWSQPLVTFTMWEAASPNPQITLIIVNAVMIIINQKNRQHSEYKLSAWKSESTTKVQTHMSRCVT